MQLVLGIVSLYNIVQLNYTVSSKQQLNLPA